MDVRGTIVAWMLVGLLVGSGCGRSEQPAGDRAGQAEAGAKTEPPGGEGTKTGEETKAGGAAPKAEGGGIARRVREIAEGTPPRDPVLPPGEGIAVPATIPPGDIVIEHECSHSMQPFGTGYWSSTNTVDLAAGTFKAVRAEGDTAKAAPLPGAGTEKRTESISTLSPADVTRIRGALDEVLAGGPYEPVYALSEGIVCTLALRIGSDPPFFRIDKSRGGGGGGGGEDAVTRLIASLGSTAPP